MRRPGRRILALPIAATLAAGGLSAAETANGASARAALPFTGHFYYSVAPGPCPVVLCVKGVFQGANGGPFTEQITSLTPAGADQPGILFGKGKISIHTRRGTVSCVESFAFNGAMGGDQEAGIICEFTGGTGRLTGASGHFQAYGSQPPGSKYGSGRYDGRLRLK
jgi:hypothetical protein